MVALIPDGFAGAAFVVAALEPAVAQQDRFDARNYDWLGFFDVVAGFLEQGDRVRRDAALDAERAGSRWRLARSCQSP